VAWANQTILPCIFELSVELNALRKRKKLLQGINEVDRSPSQEKNGGKYISPRNMKACHNIITALLQSAAEIGTQSTMKSSKNNLILLIMVFI
jgi:hypothetical protein